jgi:tRNA threonylcarbamoyladenosine biosynthesis protein TsaB
VGQTPSTGQGPGAILALDTSTERAVIAVATAAGGFYEALTEAARRHGRDLIPVLRELLDGAGLRPVEIDAVAVGLGPGSYTGLRVGVTAAKTLVYATGAQLLGLDSLQAVARNAPPEALRISVIGDAQRGDLYVADLLRPTVGAPPVALAETHIEPLAAWIDRLEPGTFVLGPALDSPAIRAAILARFPTVEAARNSPRGGPLLEMALEAWADGRREDPWLLEPRYLRRSAAEDQWNVRH